MLLIERRLVSKNRSKLPAGYNRHHRKPKRFGGDDSPANISIVLKTKHEAWNVLFDNLPAIEVARLFQKYWLDFGSESKKVSEIKKIGISTLVLLEEFNKYKGVLSESEIAKISKIVASHRTYLKKEKAWRCLFSDLDLGQIIEEINNVWLDPDFKLTVQVRQEVKIVTREIP